MHAPHRLLFVAIATALVAPLLAGCTTPPQTSLPTSPSPTEPVPIIPEFGPNVTVSADRAHRETSLALHPTDPNVIFVCDPSGVPNIGEKQSYFFRSLDAGATWAYVDVKTTDTDPRNAVFEGGDCDVAFDQGGTLYTADSWLGSISIGSSRDNGETFTSGTPVGGTGPVADRPWLVGGPAGTVHLTYQDVQFGMPSVIWYTRSTDYGLTFLPAVPLTTATNDGAFTWTGNFVVGDGGQDLYSVYTRRTKDAFQQGIEETGPEQVSVAVSHDSGMTWTSRLVSQRPNPASFLYPSIAMDDAGILHVVFSQRTDEDHPIWYAYSSDEGVTWSDPVKALAGVSGYSPWVDAGKAGQAAIQWYGSPAPQNAPSEENSWYIYWAQVTGAETAQLNITTGTTTADPLFVGVQGETPEFNMIRLDAEGNMHFGASVMHKDSPDADFGRWNIVYQRQVAGLVT